MPTQWLSGWTLNPVTYPYPQQWLIKWEWLLQGGKYRVNLIPSTKVDEITLSPSLGSKNQILITINQTVRITKDFRRGPKFDSCTPSARRLHSGPVGVLKVLSGPFAEFGILAY